MCSSNIVVVTSQWPVSEKTRPGHSVLKVVIKMHWPLIKSSFDVPARVVIYESYNLMLIYDVFWNIFEAVCAISSIKKQCQQSRMKAVIR